MKISKRYRPELVVSRGKEPDPILMDPYLDAKEDRLVAMNRHALVALPVETDKGERSRYLARPLLEAARKLGEAAAPAEIRDEEIVEYGVLWPTQQARQFPPWRTIVPDLHRGDPGTTTIHLNPKLLRAVAAAMDCESGVAITFQVGAVEAPILVQPLLPDPVEFGVMMPLRQGEDEEDVAPDQRCRICRRLLAAGAKCPEHPNAPSIPDDVGTVGPAAERLKDAIADVGRTKDGTRVSVSVNGGEEHDLTAFAEKRDAAKRKRKGARRG